MEMKIEEYLRRKNAKKQGLFNDEIDFGSDYYEDFDIEDAEDRDNLNSYDYSDFIANNDPGVYQGNHRIYHISQRITINILFFKITFVLKGGNVAEIKVIRHISYWIHPHDFYENQI